MGRQKDGYTGCLVTLLLFVAFVVGGMWGGIVGSGLVMWAFRADERIAPAELVQVLPPTPTVTDTPRPTPTAIPLPTATPLPAPTPAALPVEEAVARVLDSVVTVVNRQVSYGGFTEEDSQRIVGTGIIIDGQGYIITNAHVVINAEQLSIILSSGQELPAVLVAETIDFDLAMLKVEAADLPTASWGDSNAVRLGQPVVAIGSALGDFPNSVTMGVVSGLNRALALDRYVVHGLIQTDAAINQGNSGGPLINLRGEIIGINTFMIREDHNQGVAQGIGFAIPASSVKTLAGGWIAAETNQVPESLHVEEGALPVSESSSEEESQP